MPRNVYVIELDPSIRSVRRFAEANPLARPDKPCLYVGCTALSPEERFAQHKAGYKAARFVEKFGVRLRPRYYAKYNPLDDEAARKLEVELARRLRKKGFAVWQN
jgi:predicted GIY-YIG superfamily endonuclease